MGGDQPFPSPASVHHGLVQCHSGHSASSQSGDWVRVDSPSGGSRSLVHKWPAVIVLFAMSLTAGLPVYFSPASDSRAAGTDALLQPCDTPGLCLSSDRHYKESSCRTEVFKELRVHSHRSVLASGGLVPGACWNCCPIFPCNCPVGKIF